MQPLSEILRRRRNRCAMTLKDLSKAAGVSESTISLCECGARPSEASAEKLERALQCADGELRRRLRLLKTPSDVLALIPDDVLAQYVEGAKV